MANQTLDRRSSIRDASDTRTVCYDKIRTCVTDHLARYYTEHPDRLLDDRSLQKLEVIRNILTCVLKALEEYDLEPRGGPAKQAYDELSLTFGWQGISWAELVTVIKNKSTLQDRLSIDD